MTATLLASGTFNFADGNGGHVCDLGSAPSANQWDVLCVNSNTVINTGAMVAQGFTVLSSVGGQGAYVCYRKASGGEGSTVTVTTSGNHDTAVGWSRWGNTNVADTAVATQATGAGSSTPAHSTGALAETNELVVAFGALHSLGAPLPTAPVWSGGYTGLTSVTQGTGSSGVVNYVGYKLTAGTAAETPSVSWTNATATDRYMLTVTFTTVSGGLLIPLTTVTETDVAPALVAKKQRALTTVTEADTAGSITPVTPVVPDIFIVTAPQRAVVISGP